jgi:hypothetical protein
LGSPELDTNVTFVNPGVAVDEADVVFVVVPVTIFTVEVKVTLATSLAVLPSRTAVTEISFAGSPGFAPAAGMPPTFVQVTTVVLW